MPYLAQDVVDDVRFFIGKVDCSIITDQDIYDIMVRFEPDPTRPDENKCSVTFKTLLETLRYLIRNYQSLVSSSDGSFLVPVGAIEEVEEVIGKRKKRIKYTNNSELGSSGNWKDHWEDLLDYYMVTGLSSIGCSGQNNTNMQGGKIIIGVSKNPYEMSSPFRDHLNYPRFNRKWDRY